MGPSTIHLAVLSNLGCRHVYTQNLWSFLDVGFIAIFGSYLTLRTYGWYSHDPEPGRQAIDVMALAAPVVVPRLAFNLLSDSMVFLSLRAMMGDFAILTALSAWCFAGFLISLQWLHPDPGTHDPLYAPSMNPLPRFFFFLYFNPILIFPSQIMSFLPALPIVLTWVV